MEKPRLSIRMRTAALAAVFLLSAGITLANDWLAIDPSGAVAIQAGAPAAAPQLAAESDGLAGLRATVATSGLEFNVLENKVGQFVELTWPDAAIFGEVGTPALPVVRRLFIAPQGATITVNALTGPAITIDAATLGRSVIVKPVQPPIEKLPGAIEQAIFQMDPTAYQIDADVSGERVSVQELGRAGNQRLCALEIRPVGYNPVKQVLTVYPSITADVRFDGSSMPLDLVAPVPGLNRVVLNPELLPVDKSRGMGNYVIIVTSAYESAIASFASAKTSQGFTVTTHAVAAGTTKETIKSYIAGLYAVPATRPNYVLLVGDTDTIPHWVGLGSDSPATDLQYVCMGDSSDWVPDIAIGRFPVRSTAQLDAIVAKTLYYEAGAWSDPEYVKRAVFMASEDNYSITEGTHNYVIQNYMAPNEIASDKLYCHTFSATTAQVTASFNGGRFFGIYSGHGAVNYWADGPLFQVSHVNALTNTNMYAFVCSFSCLTGQYTTDECFMETWVRAANKGAAAAWGSSVTSYWTEDDILEKRLFDTIYDANQPSVAKELGPVILETKLRYLAHFGTGGSTRRYFEMYNLFGDPAMSFPGNCSQTGTLVLDKPKYACSDNATLRVLDCGPNVNPNVADTITVTIASTSEATGESVLLTETNPNSALFVGSIPLSTTNASGVLLVAPGDVITATYVDADNGQGQQVPVVAYAEVDCVGPVISNVHATDIEPRTATIAFTTDEPARGTVHYGLSCDALNQTTNGSGASTSPTVALSGLQDNTTYYYKVDAFDEAGNMTSDPTCYTFATPEVPDFFTQLFTSDNDLRNMTLFFTPNGSVDYYSGCVEAITQLPTDPTGGTTLTFSPSNDDGYAQVTPPSVSVSLYGVSYSSFWVGSNGYITFTSGDSTTGESLANHFSQPRISALFDDLNPGGGGSVSWKKLVDRVVVTWLNVPEYNTTNQNTFQIEMFFDGRITISYLAVAATDGLAGLSKGGGVDPDYYPSDLSAMGSCGPKPPVATGGSVSTGVGAPVTVTLQAMDDGLPDPPGALNYIVTTLPIHGVLGDPGAAFITAAPYTLVGGGNAAVYYPNAYYQGADSFQFKANDGGTAPEGGDSAIVTIAVTIGGVQRIHNFPLDSDPGWTTQGQWAFGVPQGGGSHGRDPNTGHTGQNVYGYNLAGDYANRLAATYLTTTALDCQNYTGTELRFWRWLGVEDAFCDHAAVDVSNDGTIWTTLWSNPAVVGGAVSDTAWTQQTYSISTVADGQPTVYIRWTMGTTDSSVTYPGWNIDDVEIWGSATMAPLPGDTNCDGIISYGDINPFVVALTGQAAYENTYPTCRYLNADVNGDGIVSYGDINPFVIMLGGR